MTSFISHKLSDLLIKKIQVLTPQKNEYQQLVNNLLHGIDLIQKVINIDDV